MVIDWNQFTPYAALSGGLLIGLATSVMILFNGRIAGISGIIGKLLPYKPGDVAWRIAFLGGMVLAPFIYGIFFRLPEPRIDAGFPILIVAGVLVGMGTGYSSGCTTGHGICGLSRFSLRSLVATLLFMGTGFATVFIVHHLF